MICHALGIRRAGRIHRPDDSAHEGNQRRLRIELDSLRHSIGRAGRIRRHGLTGALRIAAQGGRDHPGVRELRVELQRAIGVTNAHDGETPARTNVAVGANDSKSADKATR